MKTALNKWCLPAEMSVQQAIELCAQLGYDGLELNLADEGELRLETTQEEFAEIAACARAADLALPSVSTGLHWRYPITSADADIRARGLRIVRKQLEAASIFGADTVLLVPGLVTAGDRYDLVWRRAVDALQELAEDAVRHQVHIGIENVANHFLLSPLEMRDFIDTIDSPWVGAYYDVGNTVYIRQGWPQHWIQILGNRICKVHVKDHRASATSFTPVPLLTGDTIDWPSVMEALHTIGYDDYITVEISPYKYYPLKLAEDTVHSLATLVSST